MNFVHAFPYDRGIINNGWHDQVHGSDTPPHGIYLVPAPGRRGLLFGRPVRPPFTHTHTSTRVVCVFFRVRSLIVVDVYSVESLVRFESVLRVRRDTVLRTARRASKHEQNETFRRNERFPAATFRPIARLLDSRPIWKFRDRNPRVLRRRRRRTRGL